MVRVVCTGGEAPPSLLSLSWLGASHRIIAADGGLVHLKNLGKKADLLIGDGDSLEGTLSDWVDWYKEARLLDRVKDDSDTEAAVKEAVPGGGWTIGGPQCALDGPSARVNSVVDPLGGSLEPWSRRSITAPSRNGFHLPFVLGSLENRVHRFTVAFGRSGFLSVAYSLSNEALSQGASLSVKSGRFLVLRSLEGTL